MRRILAILLLFWAVRLADAQSAFTVGFDKQRYDVLPGETIPLNIVIDPAPGAGLFSYGLELLFDPASGLVASEDAISVPAGLNFNGPKGPGALKAVGAGFAGVKGTVDFFAEPSPPYLGSSVATFNFTDNAPSPTPLRLDLFLTLGANESVFVDGLGNVLDDKITFGSATINRRPSVTITSPTLNQIFGAADLINFAGQAADMDGQITKLELFLNGTLATSANSASLSQILAGTVTGTNTIELRATDDLGATNSAISSFVIRPANLPPTVTFTQPLNGANFPAGTQVDVTIKAEDADGTINVLTLVVDDTATFPAAGQNPFSIKLPVLESGIHTFRVHAVDNGGATADSSISITIGQPVNIPPQVAIISPADNTEFLAGSPVPVTVTANDPDGTIASVGLFDGATKLGERAEGPYTFVVNTLTEGAHTLTAVAADTLGASSSAGIHVIIKPQPVNIPPTVSITSPTANAEFVLDGQLANVPVAADASDPGGLVAKVDFFLDEALVSTDSSAPFAATLAVPVGSHTLSARATDNLGATSTSANITIRVRAPNQPPVVTITSPSNGADFDYNQSIPLAATASDPDGTIANMLFFLDGTPIGDVQSQPPFQLLVGPQTPGNHTFIAKATDNAGTVSSSDLITITVRPNNPPAVAIISPASGTIVGSSTNVEVSVTATDQDGTITRVVFYLNDELTGTVLTPPFTFRLNQLPIGTNAITVVAFDNSGSSTASTSMVVVLAPPAFDPPSSIALDRQTGLYLQTVRIRNNTATTAAAMRLHVNNLPAAVRLNNTSGATNGVPYVQVDGPFNSGDTIALTLEYFVTDRRTIPTGIAWSVEIVSSAPPPNPTGDIIQIARTLRLRGGNILVEFRSISGRTYYIQYSDDLTNWRTAQGTLTGTGNSLQWIDNGPPKTSTVPSDTTSRFYRVLLPSGTLQPSNGMRTGLGSSGGFQSSGGGNSIGFRPSESPAP